VVDRAGTLVVIAGRRAMPAQFRGSPLGDLLPVEADPAATPDTLEEEYHVVLTPEGRRSVMLRLEPGENENARFWATRPPVYWRSPVLAARASAAVLAFAQPPSVVADERVSAHAGSSAQDRQYQRARPLVVTQQAGLGRVVFLAFDSTWRLRHREGDTYHHRFWGQLLRWATGGALPAGTALVKLGSDQERYALNESVTVRARLLQPDLSPLLTNEAAVSVRRDGGLVLRRRLEYIGDLPGMYAAEIGQLASGSYTVELEGPEVKAALAAEGLPGLSTSFSVDPAASTEQVDLAADAGLPRIVAEMTGGVAVPVWEASSVVDALRPAEYTVEERADYDLWSSWPLLAALLGLATAEWVLRKRVGLP
jgi:hypothetical protein